MSCLITEGNIYTIRSITLENSLVQAVILTGKGCDLFRFVWKPLGINCLYRSDTPLEAFQDADLSVERLKHHSDRSLGGWMDALPHRGLYKNIELTQQTGGIAATLPWSYEIVENSAETASLRCFVDLPLFPLRVEKVFTLRGGSAELVIDERVTHTGDSPMKFTWTQHLLFGGDFVDEDTVVSVPSEVVFKAWEHMDAPDDDFSRFENPVSSVKFKGGVFDLTHPLPKTYGGGEFIVFHKLANGEASLFSPKLGLSVRLCWDLKRFPYLRSLYLSENASCVVGLEPGDDLFSGLEHSLKHNTYTSMQPGETIATGFTLGFSKI